MFTLPEPLAHINDALRAVANLSESSGKVFRMVREALKAVRLPMSFEHEVGNYRAATVINQLSRWPRVAQMSEDGISHDPNIVIVPKNLIPTTARAWEKDHIRTSLVAPKQARRDWFAATVMKYPPRHLPHNPSSSAPPSHIRNRIRHVACFNRKVPPREVHLTMSTLRVP